MGKQKVRIDLTGKPFGYLTVLEFAGTDKWGAALWRCICSKDGNETIVVGADLRSGKTKSCGCGSLSRGKDNPRYSHGQAGVGHRTPEYRAWIGMRRRCNDKNSRDYFDYGRRGIKVCERWSGPKGFENFLFDMGKRPSKKYSLDRWPNNNGHYEPSNCRWATPTEQANNRRKRRSFLRTCPHCGKDLYPNS